ncbi:hypothetical protein OXX59_006842 [Metschnikowia pulcherrima]
MENQNEEISLFQAEEIFKNAINASSLGISDPTTINGEIASLKEFCSKLKFQYLEQESRDKFLRLLFLNSIDSVNRKDLDALFITTTESKKELKSLKQELERLSDSSEATANQVIQLNKRMEARRPEVDAAIEDLKNSQAEFDKLVNAPENESYKMLLDLNKMIDSYDVRPDEAIRIAAEDLSRDQVSLDRLSEQKRKLEAEEDQTNSHIEQLSTKLRQLKSNLQSSSVVTHDNSDPEQLHAQWLRELNGLLQKFTPEGVVIKQVEGTYLIQSRGTEITLDKDLKVLSVPGRFASTQELNMINKSTGEQRFFKLSRLLARVLSP